MVFDLNWGGGGQPEPYPYCKTPLFCKTFDTSSIREVSLKKNILMGLNPQWGGGGFGSNPLFTYFFYF